ncbi:MAG TPA: ABC transporter ATP-binding protein [Planctomycetota bacterium]|nr:ABC transporter ATP-binding protein [Planctomycetota bacterium]
MSDAAIRTVDLVKRYEGASITALAGVSIEVERGSFLCIMGPSGSGKSTFLNLVGALDTPTSGEVILNGRPLSKERNLDAVRAREVGFIFQLHNLIPTLTSIENVEIPMMAVGVPRRERRQRAVELLGQVGLSHRLSSVATRLSGGERQRVSIARALANKPALILGDEPTGDVDSKTGDQIMACIQEARKQSGATLVVVTHNPDVAKGADRMLHMRDGVLQ